MLLSCNDVAYIDADMPVVNPGYDPSGPTGFTGNRHDPGRFFPYNASIDVKRLYYPD